MRKRTKRIASFFVVALMSACLSTGGGSHRNIAGTQISSDQISVPESLDRDGLVLPEHPQILSKKGAEKLTKWLKKVSPEASTFYANLKRKEHKARTIESTLLMNNDKKGQVLQAVVRLAPQFNVLADEFKKVYTDLNAYFNDDPNGATMDLELKRQISQYIEIFERYEDHKKMCQKIQKKLDEAREDKARYEGFIADKSKEEVATRKRKFAQNEIITVNTNISRTEEALSICNNETVTTENQTLSPASNRILSLFDDMQKAINDANTADTELTVRLEGLIMEVRNDLELGVEDVKLN